MMFTNVLVPFDTSKHALRALEVAKGFAADDPARSASCFQRDRCCDEADGSGRGGWRRPRTAARTTGFSASWGIGRAERPRWKAAIGDMLDDLPGIRVAFEVVNSDGRRQIDRRLRSGACLAIYHRDGRARPRSRLRGTIGSVSYGVLRSSDVPGPCCERRRSRRPVRRSAGM